jgi:hypothetical protein
MLIAAWALSLVAVAHVGAAAQQAPAPPPPGVEVRFVLNPDNSGPAFSGRLMALIDGRWVPVTLEEHKGGVVPLRTR